MTNFFFFFHLAASALYLKIQHLETLNTELSSILDEILVTYLILINALRCMPKKDGWLVTKQASRSGGNSDKIRLQQVVLSLDELQGMYHKYVGRKDMLLVQEFSSKLVLN